MALIKDGYWQDTYWASRYWQEDYWAEYGTYVPPPVTRHVMLGRVRPPLLNREFLVAMKDYLEIKVKQHE